MVLLQGQREDVRGQKDKEIRMHEVKCTKNQKKLKKKMYYKVSKKGYMVR